MMKNDNVFNIDFSLLDEIPDGLDEFKADGVFLEQCRNELEDTEFEQAVFDRWVDKLTLWWDKFLVSRESRVRVSRFHKVSGREPKNQLDTVSTFYRADEKCHPSHPVRMATLLMRAKRLIMMCLEAILRVPQMLEEARREARKPLEEEIEKLNARVKELEEEQRQTMERVLEQRAAPAQQQERRRKEKEDKPLTEKDVDEFLGTEDLKIVEYDDRTRKFKTAVDYIQGLKPDVTEAEVLRFVNGLEPFANTAPLSAYVDRGTVESGWLAEYQARAMVMCDVYAEFANCLGKDGNKMTAKSIQNALVRYFGRKSRGAKA